jgi:phosphoglycolate phosphatase
MLISTILFDLDGTLIDSAPSVAYILNGIRKSQGLDELQISTYRQWISLGANDLVRNAMEVQSQDVSDLVIDFRARYRELVTHSECLYSGVTQTISTLAREGFMLAVCSNKPEQLCIKVLSEIGLLSYFGCVVGGDTTDYSKPHRKPLDFALEKLGTSSSSAILVGDSSVDQRAAQAAGLPFVFYTGGYDDGVKRDVVYKVIDKVSQVLDIVSCDVK